MPWKVMVPPVLKEGGYVEWAERVEEYCGASPVDGISEAMKEVAKMEIEINRERFDDLVTGVDYIRGGEVIYPVF